METVSTIDSGVSEKGVVTMAIEPAAKPIFRFADRDEINRLMDDIEEQIGFVPDPDATPEKVRQLMLADGIRPEENAFSREIMRMRYGDQE
jgi:hypothetical protein